MDAALRNLMKQVEAKRRETMEDPNRCIMCEGRRDDPNDFRYPCVHCKGTGLEPKKPH